MKPNIRLKQERERKGWSQARVAEQIGTDPATVSRWERGASSPYPFFREKLCLLFGKDVHELGLLEEDEAPLLETQQEPELPHVTTEVQRLYDPAIPVLTTKSLVGRATLLHQLKKRLLAGNTLALTALNGLPGVGKTALALALAVDPEIQNHFHHGILWTGLGPDPNVIGLLSRWGTLLGFGPNEKEKLHESEDWTMVLRAAIGERHMLLVIDDAWQLEAALAFKIGGPNCSYLLTTRFPPLALSFTDDAVMTVRELNAEDGIALLTHFVPRLVERDPDTAQALVQAVGGLPLALTLIGRYLRMQSYSGQPRRLVTAIKLLRTTEQRLLVAQPQALIEKPPYLPTGIPLSLQAAITVSDQQLASRDRVAFYALSVFPAKPNAFPEQAALAVCQAPVETLDRLTDAGLLESSGPDRYTLHQTIADYASLHVKDSVALKRMSTYYMHYVEENEKNYNALEVESANVFTALEAAFTQGWHSELLRTCNAFAPFLYARGLHALAEFHLKRAYHAGLSLDDTRGVVSVLQHLGDLAEILGEYTQADAYLLEGLELARRHADLQQTCAALASLGLVARRSGRYSDAETYLQEGLLLARQINDSERICTILKNLGSAAGEQGNYMQEEANAREGLELARRLNLLDRIPELLLSMGAASSDQGNDRQAEEYYQEALQIARERGNRTQICLLLTNIGWLAAKQEKFASAEAYLHEGLALARQTGNRQQAILLLINLGSTLGRQGNHTASTQCYHDSLILARQINHQRWTSLILVNLGEEEGILGNYAEAERYFLEGIALARQVAAHRTVSDILVEWGELLLKQGRLDEALEMFHEVRERATGKEQDVLARVLYFLARISLQRGNVLEARQMARESLAIFEGIEHPTTAELRAFLATLAPEDVHEVR